jgi:molecular chaperone GrpE
MGIDELEDAKDGEPDKSQPSEPESSPPSDEEDKSARVDAAKAFFRAMYAGEEPPASFGSQSQQQAPADAAATSTACRKCEGLEYSLKEAEQKTSEAETLYKRMAADFDNYRRRMEREREESVALGVKKAAEALLPAIDDLGRAMQFLSPDTPSDKVIESFKLVGNRIMQCMEQVGLKKINALGEQFDPKYHEPVQQVETTEYPDGAVMQELRPGYVMHDRVVRPSLVNVASNASGVVTGPQSESAPEPPVSQPENIETKYDEAATNSSELEHTVIASVNSPEFQNAENAIEAEDPSGKVYDLGDTGE